MSNTADGIMFVRDVAARLSRSEAQIRWMIQQGQLPKPAKIGGRVCWRQSQIEAFIDEAFAKAGA